MEANDWFSGQGENGLMIIKDLIAALAFLINTFRERMGIHHGDIKLENFLVNYKDYVIRIADFGLACNLNKAVNDNASTDWTGFGVIVQQLIGGLHRWVEPKKDPFPIEIKKFFALLQLMDEKPAEWIFDDLMNSEFMIGVSWEKASQFKLPFKPVLLKDLTKIRPDTFLNPETEFGPSIRRDGSVISLPRVFKRYAHRKFDTSNKFIV